jgi:arylsulfatase A-like enzyme
MRRHGVRDFQTPLTPEQWNKTFPALLRQNGYRTAYLGKYAVGAPISGEVPAMPADEFDLWYGFPQMIAFKQVVDGKERYLTTVMTEKATAFLDEVTPDQPFCLIMAFKEPHGPLNYWDPEFPDPYADTVFPLPPTLTADSFEALPEFVRNGLNNQSAWLKNSDAYQEAMRKLHGYTSRADLAMGRIRQALKQRGLDKNTVIIHTSDNGSMDGAHALEGKWLMYEESIRVPLVILDPRLPVSTHGRRQQMALNIDLAPTILAMAGIAAPDTMQGMDLRPILRDPKQRGREDWYYEHVYNTSPPRSPIPPSEGVRTDRWKYIRYIDPQPPVEQLFDLVADPLEQKDLAGDPAYNSTLSSLRTLCEAYGQSLVSDGGL